MKWIGGILRYELSVWMRNGRRENHFGLDCVKNKIQTNKKANWIKHVKIVRIRSFSSPHFPAFGLNTKIYRVNLHTGKLWKNKDQKNSEYEHFSRNDKDYLNLFLFIFKIIWIFNNSNKKNAWRWFNFLSILSLAVSLLRNLNRFFTQHL